MILNFYRIGLFTPLDMELSNRARRPQKNEVSLCVLCGKKCYKCALCGRKGGKNDEME